MPAELDFDKIREFRLKPVAPAQRNLIVSSTVWVAPLEQADKRESHEGSTWRLLGIKLTYDRSLLSEPQDSFS